MKVMEMIGKHNEEVALELVSIESFVMYMYQDIQTLKYFYAEHIDGIIFHVKVSKWVTFDLSKKDEMIVIFKELVKKLWA